MKYYKVTAKCGHVGNGMFCVKNFYVKAKNKKEARSIVRKRPRVKKSMNNPIVDIHRISFDEYCDGLAEWINDPYFRYRTAEGLQKAKSNGYKLQKIKMPGRFDGKTFIRRPKKYKNLNKKQSDEYG